MKVYSFSIPVLSVNVTISAEDAAQAHERLDDTMTSIDDNEFTVNRWADVNVAVDWEGEVTLVDTYDPTKEAQI